MIDIVSRNPAARGAWATEARAMVGLALPLIMTNVAQILLGFTDVIMMGWLGPEALAAGALATNLNFAFLIFGIGLVTGTAPLIAIELGRARHSVRDVRRSVRQGLWAAITISVPFFIVLWNGEFLLLRLGQDADLARQAGGYLRTLEWGMLPFLGYIVLRNFLSALERPMAAMWVGGLAIIVNALLVYLLMFGGLGIPALGLVGAGIGTTLANCFLFGGLVVVVSRDRRFRRYHLFGRFWRPDWARFRDLWRIGLPIAFTLVFEVSVFNAAAILMGLISIEALAAHAIAIQIASLAFMVPLGIGMAATVRVGRAYGARNLEAISRAGWTAFVMAIGFACTTAALMLFGGRQLAGIFVALDDPANQAVIGLAVTFMIYAGLFQLFDGGQAVATGMLRGLGDTRVPMLYAALGYWGIGLTLSIVLGFWTSLAGTGIWIGLATGLFVVSIMLTVRWARRDKLGLTSRPPPDAEGIGAGGLRA